MKPEVVTDNVKVGCLSYCSFAVKRHHDEGSLYKKALNWGLSCSFSRLMHGHHDRKHGSR